MNLIKLTAASAVMAFAGFAANAASVDTVEAGTGFFTPVGGFETSSPYYRGEGDNWGWTHGAIAAGFTSAALNISAYDVDAAPCGLTSCEVNNIEAYDAATDSWLLLGALEGASDVFSFTEFDIYGYDAGVLIDDIVAGLQLRIDIDVLGAGWLVSLSKSVITTDGADPGNPNPGTNPIPLPAAGWLMIAGIGGLAAVRRRRKSA
ncbi:MAG: VPLPA-CTERM sorting domain-containing protein [Sedimentitalea sp.]